MTMVSRATLTVLLASVALGCGWPTAKAQQDTFSQQLTDMRNSVGLGSARAPIDFTERPPLVVPPSNTLPLPGSEEPALAVNDPDLIARRKALTDSRRPVPPSDPGATAQGLNRRTYLVDPPSGLRDPRVVASDITLDKSSPSSGAVKSSRRRHAKRTPAPEAQ